MSAVTTAGSSAPIARNVSSSMASNVRVVVVFDVDGFGGFFSASASSASAAAISSTTISNSTVTPSEARVVRGVQVRRQRESPRVEPRDVFLERGDRFLRGLRRGVRGVLRAARHLLFDEDFRRGFGRRRLGYRAALEATRRARGAISDAISAAAAAAARAGRGRRRDGRAARGKRKRRKRERARRRRHPPRSRAIDRRNARSRLVPIRARSRCERRSLRTFAAARTTSRRRRRRRRRRRGDDRARRRRGPRRAHARPRERDTPRTCGRGVSPCDREQSLRRPSLRAARCCVVCRRQNRGTCANTRRAHVASKSVPPSLTPRTLPRAPASPPPPPPRPHEPLPRAA